MFSVIDQCFHFSKYASSINRELACDSIFQYGCMAFSVYNESDLLVSDNNIYKILFWNGDTSAYANDPTGTWRSEISMNYKQLTIAEMNTLPTKIQYKSDGYNIQFNKTTNDTANDDSILSYLTNDNNMLQLLIDYRLSTDEATDKWVDIAYGDMDNMIDKCIHVYINYFQYNILDEAAITDINDILNTSETLENLELTYAMYVLNEILTIEKDLNKFGA